MKCIVTPNGKFEPNLPIDEIYIGRGSIYGNPFKIGVDGNRTEVVAKFRVYFYEKLSNQITFKQAVHALKGKKLACFCAPYLCHGDVIAEYVNSL